MYFLFGRCFEFKVDKSLKGYFINLCVLCCFGGYELLVIWILFNVMLLENFFLWIVLNIICKKVNVKLKDLIYVMLDNFVGNWLYDYDVYDYDYKGGVFSE